LRLSKNHERSKSNVEGDPHVMRTGEKNKSPKRNNQRGKDPKVSKLQAKTGVEGNKQISGDSITERWGIGADGAEDRGALIDFHYYEGF